jgi:hypothetical protein
VGVSKQEVENHVRACVRYWVWGGFAAPEDVARMVEDIIEEGVTADWARAVADEEFESKRTAEASWPAQTDCDKLDQVFARLDAAGICALQNAGYTQSDGRSDVEQALDERGRGKYLGYCFFHGQDLERAVDGNGLMLAFGDLRDDKKKSALVAERICDELKAAGFAVTWSGDVGRRIEIAQIDWKRRL